MKTVIAVENGDTLKALQGFLQALLGSGVVDALLVPMRTPNGTVTPALVTSPELISEADPLAPVLPVNAATLAGQLSVKEPRAKVGVVLRSCELRALVELTKMQQACLDSLMLIALDCAGTYNVPLCINKINRDKGQGVKDEKQVVGDKGEEAGDGGELDGLWLQLYRQAATHPESPDPELRSACKICEQPVYDGAQITIELLGNDVTHEIRISLPDELGTRMAMSETLVSNERLSVIDKLVAARAALRDAEFAKIRERLESKDGIDGVFTACIRCHNCMTVCPICYCKTCVFKSAIFDHEPMQFINWARQKGAYRMPADTMLFHLTRLNHMALSCVGCGMCTEACPAELPVGIVFRAIGQRLQAAFEYVPGRSYVEPLPLVTFKADEWTEVGE